mmetsp:Transcript_18410/g.42500  ORF Transcript_18410/g.42500 Transcript_18410/m.42500 type:complete len:94 (-) Transcript_18410:763-1044(-)
MDRIPNVILEGYHVHCDYRLQNVKNLIESFHPEIASAALVEGRAVDVNADAWKVKDKENDNDPPEKDGYAPRLSILGQQTLDSNQNTDDKDIH